jgi:segregation and condensation protein A
LDCTPSYPLRRVTLPTIRLYHDVFARGAPEWVGTRLATDHQVDVVGFLWASMALFYDGARDVDAGVAYRPPWHDLHSRLAARQRILAMLESLPHGVPLERFLPEIEAVDDISSRFGLRRRAAWASTLLTSLELAREGDAALIQENAFMPVHVRPPDANAKVTTQRIGADALVTA